MLNLPLLIPLPAITETIHLVVAVADLVLIPTLPSRHDLRAVGSTVEIVEAEGKKMVFVINNGAAPRARITDKAAIVLSQHGTVAPVTIYQNERKTPPFRAGMDSSGGDSRLL